jgi:hypothetical protein
MGILDRPDEPMQASNYIKLSDNQKKMLIEDNVEITEGATLTSFSFEGKKYIKWIPTDWNVINEEL